MDMELSDKLVLMELNCNYGCWMFMCILCFLSLLVGFLMVWLSGICHWFIRTLATAPVGSPVRIVSQWNWLCPPRARPDILDGRWSTRAPSPWRAQRWRVVLDRCGCSLALRWNTPWLSCGRHGARREPDGRWRSSCTLCTRTCRAARWRRGVVGPAVAPTAVGALQGLPWDGLRHEELIPLLVLACARLLVDLNDYMGMRSARSRRR